MLILVTAAFAWETWSAPLLHTTVSVTLPDGADDAAAQVFAVFTEVERDCNEWLPDSPLGRLNAGAGGAPVAIPADLEALLRRSVDIAAHTDGAFDPTWAALWALWNFDDQTVPASADIATGVAKVGWKRLEIGEGTARLAEPGMAVGLGGIAKGWALDRAAAALRGAGRPDFLLVAGGQVYAGGTKDGRPWQVGIRDPRGTATDTFATVAARDVSVSTSGDYERYFIANGVRYHHILDPHTGWPTVGARATTVVSADATLADALSTALMVLGPERGLYILGHFPGTEALIVDSEGKVHRTSGMPVGGLQAPRR
ncbi:FAD:protein FMN transferase [Deltaproteobacteria bacterium]|nr:FAD:protein FMN transferase [Deltaproteobacteria bacterium]